MGGRGEAATARLGSDSGRADTAGQGGGGTREAAIGGAGERSGRGGEREARSGGRARRAGQLSGAALSRQRFKPHCRRGGHAAAARCHAGPARGG
jgi:hypothetical protein